MSDSSVARMIRYAPVVVFLLCQYTGSAAAQVVAGCGSLQNAYGPFDYRDPTLRATKLPIVEEYHFTPQVEALETGSTGYLAMGDIDYTLRAFPNHPRALAATAKWALRGGRFPNQAIPSAECYFERAVAFAPDDATVRAIYGTYLFKRHKNDDARQQYEAALKLSPNSPEINYDAGLLFVELGDLPRAKALAKVAYDGGHPLPGLRKKIAEAEAGGRAKHPAPKEQPAAEKP
jgi:tetratricopeptide (TPR) repeat protein